MNTHVDSKRRRIALYTILGVCLAIGVASRPAAAQTQPVLSLNTNFMDPVHDPMSFGRGPVTFNFFVKVSAAASFDTVLNATLPPGVEFVSTRQGSATVSGSPAAGEQVAVALGQVFGTIYDYAFTISVGQSPPDGAHLAVSFQMTGHAANSQTQQVSNVISYDIQAGYIPVGVFVYRTPSCRMSARSCSGVDRVFSLVA